MLLAGALEKPITIACDNKVHTTYLCLPGKQYTRGCEGKI